MSNCLLVVGTDTDVGKTFVTISLVYYWMKYRQNNSLGLLKLMQTGEGDRELYHRLLSDRESLKISTPLHFKAPLAPPIAAEQEGKKVDLSLVWQYYSQLQQEKDFVIIEALGGLGSPVTYELTVADLATQWRLPTVLVVPVKLGAIAQAVANVALARSLNLDLRGIILNCGESSNQELQLDTLTPIRLIESLTQVSVLGILPYIEDLAEVDKITQIVSNWDLELIF